MLYAEAASVRRGDLCGHSQANSYFICLCTKAPRDGAHAEDRYGEVWTAHWHGSRPSEALEKLQKPAGCKYMNFLGTRKITASLLG